MDNDPTDVGPLGFDQFNDDFPNHNANHLLRQVLLDRDPGREPANAALAEVLNAK
jgi:hypothetical protein